MYTMEGVLYLVGCLGVLYVVKRTQIHRKLIFNLGYFLYANTPIGYYYHKRVLSKRMSSGYHSKLKTVSPFEGVDIHIIPVLSDNYSYLVTDNSTGQGVVVDPSDPNAVQKFILKKNVQLRAILTTHKHWDHAGGNETLKGLYPELEIYGSKEDSPAHVNKFIADEDVIKVGKLQFKARFTPGHTLGHMVYVLSSNEHEQACLFSGDHLFCGGCGRVFEGTFEGMLQSLKVIKSLDPSTMVFPGHEYTLKNLQFTLSIEPTNTNIENKLEEVKSLRIRRESSVPTTIRDELLFNPFMRTDTQALAGVAGTDNEVNVLEKIRQLKDKY